MIETLKDLKESLLTVPMEILETFIVCKDDDGDVMLGSIEGEDEIEMGENWQKHIDKYSELKEINQFIENIGKGALDECSSEPITSERVGE